MPASISSSNSAPPVRRALGIDPGLRLTGYGCVEWSEEAENGLSRPSRRWREVGAGGGGGGNREARVVEAGVIRLKGDKPVAVRLADLYADLRAVVEALCPDVLIVEKLYAHYAHPATAIKMGHARGVILLVAQEHEMEIMELGATEIKKAVTGHGHATKRQMQMAVQAQCGLAKMPSPPDVADAIAIALCGARRMMQHLERLNT